MIENEIKLKKKKNILLLAGVHGDERSAWSVLRRIYDTISRISNSNYNFIIIYEFNKWGINNNKRENEDNLDLNRQFGINSKIDKVQFLEKLVLSCDYVFDFHETISKPKKWGRNTNDYGRTYILGTHDKQNTEKIVDKILLRNSNYTKTVKTEIPGTLRNYCNNKKIKYCLVEFYKKDYFSYKYLHMLSIIDTIFNL